MVTLKVWYPMFFKNILIADLYFFLKIKRHKTGFSFCSSEMSHQKKLKKSTAYDYTTMFFLSECHYGIHSGQNAYFVTHKKIYKKSSRQNKLSRVLKLKNLKIWRQNLKKSPKKRQNIKNYFFGLKNLDFVMSQKIPICPTVE